MKTTPIPPPPKRLSQSEAEHLEALRNKLAIASSRFQAVAARHGLAFSDLEHAAREAARLTAPDAFEQPGYTPELFNAADGFLRNLIKIQSGGWHVIRITLTGPLPKSGCDPRRFQRHSGDLLPKVCPSCSKTGVR